MIGQQKLQEKLKNHREFPKFLIFEGPKGCGKKTLAKELAKIFNLNLVFVGTKVDNICSMIDTANNSTNNLFFIDKGNDLLPNGENTLLKITEELPNDNHIILSCEMSILLLPTIISRGELFRFENYTEEDFKEYLGDKYSNEIKYSSIYPNLSYLENRNEKEDIVLYNICKDLITFDKLKWSNKVVFNNITKANKFNLNQVLFCLEKCAYDKMLTAASYSDIITINQMMVILNSISMVNKLLTESLVYNRGYIMDYLGLRIIEAFTL